MVSSKKKFKNSREEKLMTEVFRADDRNVLERERSSETETRSQISAMIIRSLLIY
jgi:hypothetical protein